MSCSGHFSIKMSRAVLSITNFRYFIFFREGVEKLLTMLPTEEETTRINEAQEAQPDIPLGTAEQFLQTLSTISCLESRLRLWSFKMEFEVIEKEVCEPLMDLKIGIASLQQNMTFKTILNVLLTFGNFLNSSACKGMFGILPYYVYI